MILTPTYARNERYCDTLVRLMDRMWPEHPEIWFLTDGNGISHPNTLRFPGTNWIEILRGGLRELRSRYPDMSDLYLILEDLYPLWPCEGERLSQIHRAAAQTDFGAVLFFTHQCQPMINGHRAIEGEIVVEGVRLERIARDYPYYTSLQPGLWKVDHLAEVIEHAVSNRITDPWRFEFINLGGSDHYMSEYHWPCIFGGLFTNGRVNLEAIRHLKDPEFARFKRGLFAEYVQQLPGYAFARASRAVRHCVGDLVKSARPG